MVNVINNSVLHTTKDGASTSVFYSVHPGIEKTEYNEIISQIISINKIVPCSVWVSKERKSINFSFYYKSSSMGLESSRISLDFGVELRTKEEFDLSFSNFYTYITNEIGYSVSDYFLAHDDMPFVSKEKDSLYVRIKANMLTISPEDIFGNRTIIIDYLKSSDYE